MDIRQKFSELLEKEHQRLNSTIGELNKKIDETWKHAFACETETEMVYIFSALSHDEVQKNEDLERRLNEAYAKLAVFKQSIKHQQITDDSELADYTKVPINPFCIFIDKFDKRKKLYGFSLFNGDVIQVETPTMTFSNYAKLYKEQMDKTFGLLLAESKGINLNDDPAIAVGIQLEANGLLKEVAEGLLKEDPQATPTTK